MGDFPLIDLLKVTNALENRRKEIEEEYDIINSSDIDFDGIISNAEMMTHREFMDATNSEALAIPVEFKTSYKRSLGDFANLRDAIEWSSNQLYNSTLTAIDGSQIMPAKDIGYPIAMVQTGFFTITFPTDKFGDAKSNYDTLPKILLSSDSLTSGGEMIRQGDVSLQRQYAEIDTASDLLDELQDYTDPLILLDGTLIYSYMINLNPQTRKDAIKHLIRFLRKAEKLKIPVVGYIDTSYAKDLSNTLLLMQEDDDVYPISDALMLDSYISKLGDYTIPFVCRREPMNEYGIYEDKICFSYLRVNSIRAVRLEFPFWIHADEIYDNIVSRIFAEGVLSHGYPRVLTRAHEVAVLTAEEREKFHNLVLNYFNTSLQIPLKQMSKSKMKNRFY